MAAAASFSVSHENEQYQWTRRLRKPIYIPGFEGILTKKLKKIILAAILIIGGKLKF